MTTYSNRYSEIPPPAEPVHRRKTNCYPVHMTIPAPRLPHVVELVQENEQHVLKFRGETMKINSSHFYKLVSKDLFMLRVAPSMGKRDTDSKQRCRKTGKYYLSEKNNCYLPIA